MSIYVMSDLHGEYDKFEKMISLINFGDSDTLYILGDIFDRGPEPLKIFDYIATRENITMLLGNHEKLFLDCYEDIINGRFFTKNFNCWMNNGGDTTLLQIIERGAEYLENLYNYLVNLPIIKVLDHYILVHAGIVVPENGDSLGLDEILEMQNDEQCLWTRDFITSDERIQDKTVIVGHTPTFYLGYTEPKIYHTEGKVLIDCGAVYGGNLACLRLEDKKEFYI